MKNDCRTTYIKRQIYKQPFINNLKMVSQKEMKKKKDNLEGYFYPVSLLAIVIGTAFIIGWKHWILDLCGTLILALGVALNVIVNQNE